MLCATLLTSEPVVLHNIPDITDVNKMLDIFRDLNSHVDWNKEEKWIRIDNSEINMDKFAGKLPVGMRASILLFAPILSRFKHLDVDLKVGGCTLGIRDIDPHISMFQDLGMTYKKENGHMVAGIEGRFKGNLLWPEYASVTGTENAIMAAVLADGHTTIYNAAGEPHVQNLCEMLNKMGAQISGIGSNRLEIDGVDTLHGCESKIYSDHHEITTFLALGAMTGGKVEVEDALPEHFKLIVDMFHKLGVTVRYEGNTAIVEEDQSFEQSDGFTENMISKIEAAPWPYFPTDLLPLMVALSLKTKGVTKFWNKIYEGGLFWVPELSKLGAKVEVCDPHRVLIIGPTHLRGAQLECPYIIRAAVAMMMAALAAEGESILKNIDTVFRAHPNFVENLKSLGAEIEVIN